MRLITSEALAAGAAQRWKNSYFRKGEWTYGIDKEQIYLNLLALGTNPHPDVVNIVIGNNSWTNLRCDDCGKHVDEVVQMGEEPDYESSTANICKPCLILATEEFVK